jgi:hypothetical protein
MTHKSAYINIDIFLDINYGLLKINHQGREMQRAKTSILTSYFLLRAICTPPEWIFNCNREINFVLNFFMVLSNTRL